MLTVFYYIHPGVGGTFALIAYVTVALGGFGSIFGALAAGLIVGLVEAATPPKLLLDFGHVDYMSSAALGMLINIHKAIKAKNGQLRLAAIQPQIYEVFVTTKLNAMFRIAATRQEAMDSFN